MLIFRFILKRGIPMNPILSHEFSNPPAAYRAKPFWDWNGRLEEGELRRQIQEMHRMGLGGFFMHSRVGLDTPYLQPEWFKLINACVDEAGKLGMEAWLYDEDRWPSGAAGVLVTRDPRYRMRYVLVEQVQSLDQLPGKLDILAVFSARVNGFKASQVRFLGRGRLRKARAEKGSMLYVFHVATEPLSSWYNGYTYLDTLSHEAVREFIRVTHEVYRKKCGSQFGKTIPGIFTDEPNHGNKFICYGESKVGNGLPWTPKLPAIFKRRYGYDSVPHLMELFWDVDGMEVSPARYHYHDCVTHLFVDAFARQIGEWCDRTGMIHTGHVLGEDTLSSQATVVGDCMQFYEYMQAPGMDLLTERWRIYAVAKQVSSVARQFGRKWRLTETNGCTGWDFSLEGHKALGDWQMALGINLRCPHLAWYTMEGEAKRDYPASIFFQSPWWTDYAKVEDYFARTAAVMTRGTEVRDLLVLHPIESQWLRLRANWGDDPAVKAYNRMFSDLTRRLLAHQLDFDYGNEVILARAGRVERGRKGIRLRVGQAEYRAILVPPMTTLRQSTLNLLTAFHQAGGRVVFAGEIAGYVDARASDAVRTLAGQAVTVPLEGSELIRTLAPDCQRLTIVDGRGKSIPSALYQLREDREAFYLFICNTGHAPDQMDQDSMNDVRVCERRTGYDDVRIIGGAGAQGIPEEWDAESGKRFAAKAQKRADGSWEIRTSLPRLASRLFVIPKQPAKQRLKSRPQFRDRSVKPLAVSSWAIGLSEDNVLVLDQPSFRINGGAWTTAPDVLRVDQSIRKAMDIPARGGRMVQPWAQVPEKNPRTARVELRYLFDVAQCPSGRLDFALEHPEACRVAINGTVLEPPADAGWWTDPSLRRLPVDPAILRRGRNEIRLTLDYTARSGLEIVYLLGDFGVEWRNGHPAVGPSVCELKTGDWTRQGLPFYGGHVSYRTRFKAKRLADGQRGILRFPSFAGAGIRVRVNGETAGLALWPPYEIDLTAWCKGAPVELDLEVLGHRRNSHGPLHMTSKWPHWTGPGSYLTEGKGWSKDYSLVPCGLLKTPNWVVQTAVKENGI
jgi:hypothetical protein